MTGMTGNYVRLALWIALGFVLFVNYQTWEHDYGSHPTTAPAAGKTAPHAGASSEGPTSLGSSVPQLPSGAARSRSPQGSSATATVPAANPASAAEQRSFAVTSSAPAVDVRTDLLDVRVSLRGGTIVGAKLLKYPKVKGKATPVELENVASRKTLYILQTGLTGPAGGPHPTHLATFESPTRRYALAPGQQTLKVPLTWTNGHGVEVVKTFVFQRGKYQIGVEQTVENRSAKAWQAAPYAQIVRYHTQAHGSMFIFNVERESFRGPAIYDGTRYRTLKLSSEKSHPLSLDVMNGWLAAPQHDFVSAVVPPRGEPYHYSLKVRGHEFALATTGPLASVRPGAAASFHFKLFVGPTLASALAATAPHFTLIANYGRLSFLAKPLFWLLEKAHGLLGNWGLAIIAVTILLKLLLYPLTETSYRSMAKMRTLAPRIKALQETYKGEKEKSTRAMMELYKREKINPVAGCLPMVIQIPIFFAYYYVLIGSVEMRQAPFYGWIHDLSSRDPYFILPALMAIAQFFQYKLNPQPADPTQAKVMMVMPFALSAMFAFFPAGLVLYYLTNTLLTLAQQWSINRRTEAAAKRKKA